MQKSTENLIEFFIAIALIFVSIICYGFVTMKLWNWFLPLVFSEIVTITFVQACGIRLFAFFITFHNINLNEVPKDIEELFNNTVRKSVVFPATMLFAGWIVHCCV